MTFEVAYVGYQNKQESLRFVELPVKQVNTEINELAEVVNCPSPNRVCHQNQLHKNQKVRKIKNTDSATSKVLLKKKKQEGKKAKLLNKLEAKNLHMKHINSNVNRNK